MNETYTLLDTRGLMLRAFHSSPHQAETGSNGKPITSWQDGLAKCITDIVNPLIDLKTPTSNIIAVWDGGNDYRLGFFPDYKRKRLEEERDKSAVEQITRAKDQLVRLLAYLGIKSVYVPGEEADDLVALLCDRLEADHFVVRTIDGDLTQLVSDKVSVWLKDRFYEAGSKFKDRIPFGAVRLYKALVGDSTDGFLGVPKLGQQKFLGLLEAYGEDGLEQITQALETNDWSVVEAAQEATKDSTLKMMLEHWSDARQALRLATLAPHACYGNYRRQKPKRPVWTVRVPNRTKVLEILTELGLEPEITRYEHLFPTERLIDAEQHEELQEIAEEIFASPVVSWDYESTDTLKHPDFQKAAKSGGGKYVDVLSQKLAGISINYGTYMEKTVYVPFDHRDTACFSAQWGEWLISVLNAREQGTVVQNANFELAVTWGNMLAGEELKAPYDTAIMASYVDEDKESDLKSMSRGYLHYRQATYEEATQGRGMNELTGQEVLSYGCDDSLVTSHLFVLFRTIMQLEGSWKFYCENEREPAIDDVRDFMAGQEIDLSELERQKKMSLQIIDEQSSQMRDVLEAHVQGLDQDELIRRAMVLYQEWYNLERFKAEGDEKKDEEIRTRLWERAWRYCQYEPFTSKHEIPDFVSTPTLLNKVVGLIDQNAPKIEKANGPGVQDYESIMQMYFDSQPNILPEAFEKLQEYIKLLFAARRKLGAASRKGEAYEALAAFCSRVLSGGAEQVGKVITHGDELNINSTPQMQGLLYGKLGLPIRKHSKVDPGSERDKRGLKGGAATGLKAIEAAFVYDLPEEGDWKRDVLMAYRQLAVELQKQSLYYAKYPLWRHPRDGRIHPQIRNCGTVTRRPSGSSPNVLQVSKKEGALIRKVFVAGNYGDGGRVVISADFANQELVITACESRDPVMLDAFSSEPRKDLHSVTSCGFAHILMPRLILGWSGQPIDYEQFMAMRHGDRGEELQKAANTIRNKFGKSVSFLISYLGGPTTLAGNLLIPLDLAKQLMQGTFDLYARLAPWQREVVEFAREHGYTQTAYGNRRHATADLYSNDDFLRTRQERQLVNAIIQGGAADILKQVRQEIYRRKMQERYAMRAIAPVYDEIKASVPVDRAVDYCLELVEVMSITPPGYPVGMKVDLSIGPTWGDQVELDNTDAETIERAVIEQKEAKKEAA